MEWMDFIKENKDAMVKDIVDFINIPTMYDEDGAKEGQPFGKDVDRGLKWILAKAAEMGMAVKDYDGYAGEVTIGNGSFMIGILAHEDVVAAGEGWETEPFDAVVKDGNIYGRGTADDKGPLISSLYAMKYLLDENRVPNDTCVRLIIGTNEEESWGGINYYVEHAERLPDYSIVPDGYFPLIFCEKGLFDFNLEMKPECNEHADVLVRSLQGGSGRNIVPGKASCDLKCVAISSEEIAAKLNMIEGITASSSGDSVFAESRGKSTHAMSPEKGINAINRLLNALGELDISLSMDDFIDRYNENIGMTYNGEKMGLNFEDELSGKLTYNTGIIKWDGETVLMESNLRYPASMEKQTMMQAMDRFCKNTGFSWKMKDYLPPVYTKPDSPFVTRLMNVYRDITGDMENDAFAIGGATYARAIPNAVAFGPLFPYEEELAHEANEFLSIDSLEKMTLIYGKALESLLKMKKERGEI